jgi:hypothetical protein
MNNLTAISDNEPSRLRPASGDRGCELACSGYLGAWFEALKLSPHYVQMCRTGMFMSDASFKTYELFGALEDLSFEQWWALTGVGKLGCGCLELEPGLEVGYQSSCDEFKISVRNFSPKNVACLTFHDIAAVIDSSSCKLLSMNPMTWPFFKSRISAYSINKSLSVVKACQSVGKRDKVKMWEIGEQLNLKKSATCTKEDWRIDVADKHIQMGKLVSAENRRGMNLSFHASQGIFPCATNVL